MELLTEQMLRCTNRDIGTWILQCKKIFVAVQQKMREHTLLPPERPAARRAAGLDLCRRAS
jgi:hypothetical protein